jgi:uncharacterized protein (TIRG00374 family)
VHFDEVWAGLRTSHYVWLLPALVSLAFTVLAKAIRWRSMFLPDRRPRVAACVSSLLIGNFFNSILPARAGEAARVVALNQRAGTSRAEAAATVVVERAYDMVCLLVLLFVALPWLPRVSWLRTAVVFAILLAVGIAIGIAVLAALGARPLRLALKPIAFLSAERRDHIADNFVYGLATLRRPRLALATFLWTAVGWFTLALSTWFVMRGFELELSFVAALFVVIATNLAMILPSSPAGLGVFEAATLTALIPYGLSHSAALSFALVLHALNFVPYLVAGPVILRRSPPARDRALA